MISARHGDIKQTRRQNMTEIVFSWGVSEIKYVIFIENNVLILQCGISVSHDDEYLPFLGGI
jgi:uncharacterized protein (DUF486 family)